MGRDNNFEINASEDSAIFTNRNLKKYDVIIFLNTTGTILGEEQKMALKNYIQKGGGFVGVHAATDCEYGWLWYVKMIRANFKSHPSQQLPRLTLPIYHMLPPVICRLTGKEKMSGITLITM